MICFPYKTWLFCGIFSMLGTTYYNYYELLRNLRFGPPVTLAVDQTKPRCQFIFYANVLPFCHIFWFVSYLCILFYNCLKNHFCIIIHFCIFMWIVFSHVRVAVHKGKRMNRCQIKSLLSLIDDAWISFDCGICVKYKPTLILLAHDVH